MFTITFSSESVTKNLEDLIMATKAELSVQISELNALVLGESSEVQAAIAALEAVVAAFTVKVASLEASALVEADFTAELAELASIKARVQSIYESAPVPVVEPVAEPVV